jgi:polygalacturonase
VIHRLSLLILATTLRVLAVETPTFGPAELDVRGFGARGNGRNNDTASINAAIEKCSGGGGGTVLFPAGVYSAASIHLRSKGQLLLDAEPVIAGAAEAHCYGAKPLRTLPSSADASTAAILWRTM